MIASPGCGHHLLNRGKTNVSLSPFAPEKLVSHDGFGRRVLRQPADPLHDYILRIRNDVGLQQKIS